MHEAANPGATLHRAYAFRRKIGGMPWRYSAATHYSGYAQRGIYAITILMGIRRQIYVLKVKQLSLFPQPLIVKQCGGVNLLL